MIKQQIVKSIGSLLIGILVGLALMSLPIFADWKKWQGRDFFLETPPSLGSFEEAKDFEILHAYERSRTESQCELAKSQSNGSFKTFFKDREDLLSRSEYAQLKFVMKDVEKMVDRVAEHFKVKFSRTRPYLKDTTLRPCVAPVSHGQKSYPSAHAAMGTVFSCLLSKKFSERSQDLVAYGELVGELRAIAGLHHPSDIYAGRQLAQRICTHLLADPDFIRELEELPAL